MAPIAIDDDTQVGGEAPLLLIAGPCVIEDEETTFAIADHLKDLTARLGLPLVFKASYDKANRTSIQSYRGPGLADGLRILARIKIRTGGSSHFRRPPGI